jgi:hypothetical protein
VRLDRRDQGDLREDRRERRVTRVRRVLREHLVVLRGIRVRLDLLVLRGWVRRVRLDRTDLVASRDFSDLRGLLDRRVQRVWGLRDLWERRDLREFRV